MLDKELQKTIDAYEQLYCSLDEPIPFKDGKILLYPVLVKDYYKFYSFLPCLTINKNIKEVVDDNGVKHKESNVEGIKKSYLKYISDIIESGEDGGLLSGQLMGMLELVTKIPRGVYCPKCGKIRSYEEALSGIDEYCKDYVIEVQKQYTDALKKFGSPEDLANAKEIVVKQKVVITNENGEQIEKEEELTLYDLPDELKQKAIGNGRMEYIDKHVYTCECGDRARDVFSIKNEGSKKKLMIKDVELTPKEFDELRAIIPHQNILDYDGDKYVDEDLKEELEIKQKLQNKDYASPTLEKQIVCVAVSTGYTIDYIKNELPIRKLTYLLRIADKKDTYFAQIQGAMSGMVQFKHDPPHWIFSDDKKNIMSELTEYSAFEDKFKHVV